MYYALSFWKSRMILDPLNHFGQIPIALKGCNSFWSGANHFEQVQIIKISPEKSNLNLTNIIWTQPKRFGPDQNNFYSYNLDGDKRHPQHQISYHRGLESPYFEILPTRAYKVNFSKTDILILHQVEVPKWAVEKQYYEMPELVGFQTMVILDPNGIYTLWCCWCLWSGLLESVNIFLTSYVVFFHHSQSVTNSQFTKKSSHSTKNIFYDNSQWKKQITYLCILAIWLLEE